MCIVANSRRTSRDAVHCKDCHGCSMALTAVEKAVTTGAKAVSADDHHVAGFTPLSTAATVVVVTDV